MDDLFKYSPVFVFGTFLSLSSVGKADGGVVGGEVVGGTCTKKSVNERYTDAKAVASWNELENLQQFQGSEKTTLIAATASLLIEMID